MKPRGDDLIDLRACDAEPIHIPGSVQPHGLMLVVEADSLVVTHLAGDRSLLEQDPLGRRLDAVIDPHLAAAAAARAEAGGYLGRQLAGAAVPLEISVHAQGARLILELEPVAAESLASPALMALLEASAASFERAPTLKALCERAACDFRTLTGFDRVMIYRFLDEDEAGTVVAESRSEALPSFLNHHFPGSDIPRQARALYVRNLVRVIPDVAYAPAPLTPPWREPSALDMSDCALRSVSPVHMQYLRNMGVAASASVSIVKDGVLWGMIACHHATPRHLPYDIRAACRALAGGLARQIRAKEDAEGFRERLRLRALEDEVLHGLGPEAPIEDFLLEAAGDLRRALGGDGFAILRAGVLSRSGVTPHESELRDLATWLLETGAEVFATDRLGETTPLVVDAQVAGLMATVISSDEPFLMMWFRAERVEVVNWAGNPHKATVSEGGVLNPRASFEAWAEQVRGRSAPWSEAEVEAAGRLRRAFQEVGRARRMRNLNLRLTETLADKDSLLEQKEFLLREVSHRVQNSLQLVSSFLGLQARASPDPTLHEAIEEARRRLSAVALVHRRLYRADQIEAVDLARYLEELCEDLLGSMDDGWSRALRLDVTPMLIPTDRAVTVGLILTELVININKYAYGGAPGPVEISLETQPGGFRLTVADQGVGKSREGQGGRQGFGGRMMTAMVAQLSGDLAYLPNAPGLRAVLTAPLKAPA